jgi:lipoate-protein ligase A
LKTWRLLNLQTQNAFMNMAIDEAVLTARTIDRVPNTLRLYRWAPSAVSIGKNQNPETEVQRGNLIKIGVDLVRRISGGGTVYHDERNEVTYSLTAKMSDLGVKDITAVYAKVYSGMTDALRILGITADFSEGDAKNCPNLTVKGRKISGSSQAHKRETMQQHGTLLLDVDLEKMFTLLRVPWAKTCMVVVNVARNRITSVKGELGHAVSAVTAARALAVGFTNALGVRLVEGELSSFEVELAEKLCREKYVTDDWNFQGKSIIG